jgi:hypothetical protein
MGQNQACGRRSPRLKTKKQMILRLLGYLLLIFGFIITPIVFTAEYQNIEFGVLSHVGQSFPTGTQKYDWSEWKEIYMCAFDDNFKTIRTIYPPTFMMLVGAILLDIAGYRRRKAKEPAKNT